MNVSRNRLLIFTVFKYEEWSEAWHYPPQLTVGLPVLAETTYPFDQIHDTITYNGSYQVTGTLTSRIWYTGIKILNYLALPTRVKCISIKLLRRITWNILTHLLVQRPQRKTTGKPASVNFTRPSSPSLQPTKPS